MKIKPEAYSCLKMLESLAQNCIAIHNAGKYESAQALYTQYASICSRLKENLSSEQFKFIPLVGYHPPSERSFSSSGFPYQEIRINYTEKEDIEYKANFILSLASASDLAVSYLKSLEGDIDNDLQSKEHELKKKEKDLELREKEVESMKKYLKKMLAAADEFPEVQRSGAVAAWKKNHREIEENSKKKDFG